MTGLRKYWPLGVLLVVGLVSLILLNPGSRGTGGSGEPVTLPSGLRYEDLKVGTGAEARAGDTIVVHYTGRLAENGEKFDSSLDRGEPFTFTLGQGEVIRGWDEGVAGMRVGGKRKLRIPAEMGYGSRGSPPKIPPNADLEFEVELLRVTP